MRSNRTFPTLVALVLLAGCGGAEGEPEDGSPGTSGAAANPGDTAATAMALACQPMTDRMAVEGRLSPYDSTRVGLDGGELLVCYGRPAARGRTMVGGEAVPYGTLWRTGANEPTTLHLSTDASIAGIPVGPGTYSLYTIPGESEWTVIVNASTSQWGHESSYTDEVRGQEVGRATVPAGTSDEHVESFTISSEPGQGGGATLVLEWENTRVEIPVTPAGG